MTTASPNGATYRSMEVRRVQIVWSSLRPCSRYSTGVSPVDTSPLMPIWPDVDCGRITVIDVLRPSTSEKKSQCTSAISGPPNVGEGVTCGRRSSHTDLAFADACPQDRRATGLDRLPGDPRRAECSGSIPGGRGPGSDIDRRDGFDRLVPGTDPVRHGGSGRFDGPRPGGASGAGR